MNEFAKRRARVEQKYMGADWAWHWKLSGVLWVRHIPTGRRKKIGKLWPKDPVEDGTKNTSPQP